ncbi:MAG: Bacteriohemerythrin [Syntrophus sp. SKADARSKE-3]|nr:Bacteriohemerythrin [Syntrophus sp. SKADARSKE-3]
MPLFNWTDNLSVGVREFDSHHQRLIELINILNDSIINGNDDIITKQVLVELTNYTLYHFFTEEDVMLRSGYPGYFHHRKEHLDLTGKTFAFLEKLQDEGTKLSQDVLNFLKDWLTHHILETDKRYSGFLNGKGIS